MKYASFGESHGKGLLATIDGFPAGLPIDVAAIDAELARRQGGYGRGGRQKIEQDHVEILSGVLKNVTTGTPIAIWTKNRDYKIEQMPELTQPRPGHADLSGVMKYRTGIRPILERASARETTARVAAGALAGQLLARFGIRVTAYVIGIGPLNMEHPNVVALSWDQRNALRNASSVYSLCPEKDKEAEALIDRCAAEGDTLGGIVEIMADGLPFGLGSHTQWDRKLDARLAQAVMSVQAIKGVEFGLGFESARRFGSQVHDEIAFDAARSQERSHGFVRPTNHAGGLEGGMTNTQPLVLRAAMKPIATLKKPLKSVDLHTKKPVEAAYERSDICAVSACSVVLEHAVALELAAALLEKFGGDSIEEIEASLKL